MQSSGAFGEKGAKAYKFGTPILHQSKPLPYFPKKKKIQAIALRPLICCLRATPPVRVLLILKSFSLGDR